MRGSELFPKQKTERQQQNLPQKGKAFPLQKPGRIHQAAHHFHRYIRVPFPLPRTASWGNRTGFLQDPILAPKQLLTGFIPDKLETAGELT